MKNLLLVCVLTFGLFGPLAQASSGTCTPPEEQMGCHTEGGYNGRPYCDCSGARPAADNEVVSCSYKDSSRTLDVSLRSTPVDGVFRATIFVESRFTYSIPGEPLPVLAEYRNLVHNQHMDLFFDHEGQFVLRLGDAAPAHLKAAGLDVDVECERAK